MTNPPQPWQQPEPNPQYGQQPEPYQTQPYQAQPYGAPPADPGPISGPPRTALILQLVQIGVGLLSLVFIPSTMRHALAQQPQQPGVSQDLLDTIVTVSVVVGIVVSVIWAGVMVLFVAKAWQGRNWARIVLIVFAAIGVVGFVFGMPFNIIQIANGAQTPLLLITGIPSFVLSLIVLILLVREPAKSWFPARTAYLKATGG